MSSFFTTKNNPLDSLYRHEAFISNSSFGIPLVHALLKKKDSQDSVWAGDADRRECDLLPAWHKWRIGNYLSKYEFYGDALPMANIMVGLDITNNSVLAGGDYAYNAAGDQLRFIRKNFSLDQEIPAFSPRHPLVRMLEDCYLEIAAYIGRRSGLNAPMTLDPLSTLYSLEGGMSFLEQMVTRPNVILKRNCELIQVYLDFYDYFYKLLITLGYGETGSWFNLCIPGKFEGVRCDFSVMLSNDMFGKFVIPQLSEICGHMDHSLFNMSTIRHIRFLDQLADIQGLDGVFWNPEPWLAESAESVAAMHQIREAGMCLAVVCYSAEFAAYITRKLGPDGLFLMFADDFSEREELDTALKNISTAVR